MFIKAQNINELQQRLKDQDYFILNGGTDLSVAIKNFQNKTIIDVSGLAELNYFKVDNKQVRIGATTKYCDITASEYIQKNLKGLYHAAMGIGSKQIRNAGTIIGNVCNASPGGDTPVILECYEANVVVDNSAGATKSMPISEFITGYRTSALQKEEYVKEVNFKNRYNFSFFKKYGISHRESVVISNASVGFVAQIDEGVINDCNCVFGACGVKAVKMVAINDFMTGRKVNEIAENELASLFDSELEKMCSPEMYELKKGHIQGLAYDLMEEVKNYEK